MKLILTAAGLLCLFSAAVVVVCCMAAGACERDAEACIARRLDSRENKTDS